MPNHVLPLDYSKVPGSALMVDAVKNYLEEGIPPGSFLTAVICNNFYQAVSSAETGETATLAEVYDLIT